MTRIKELEEQLNLYRTFVQQSFEGIWRAEFDRPIPTDLPSDKQVELLYEREYIAECNDNFAAMYGFNSPEEVEGKYLYNFHGNPYRAENMEMQRQFIENDYRIEGAETREVNNTGEEIIVLNNCVGIVESGELIAIWGTQLDITARRRRREKLQELNTRLEEINEKLEQKVEERTRQLKKKNEKLEELAIVDALTGLANRRRFEEILEAEWCRARRDGSSISLIIMDVDYYKEYNDFYGHPAGDECLRRLAQVLEDTARRSIDTVARYGGDEFAAILPGTNFEGAMQVAQKLNSAVRQEGFEHESSPCFEKITLSLGVAHTVPGPETEKWNLVEAADQALYEAKKAGRNTEKGKRLP